MTDKTLRRRTLIAVVTTALFAVPALQGLAQKPEPMRLGRFSITYNQTVAGRLNKAGLTTTVTGTPVVIKSTQYDLSAPRVYITARNSGNPARLGLSTANANGGVTMVARQQGGQVTNITCNSAYFVAAPPPAVGRVELKGNVRSVTRGPGYAEPLVNVAEEGTINILGPDDIDFQFSGGTLSGAVNEPAPKPKKTP